MIVRLYALWGSNSLLLWVYTAPIQWSSVLGWSLGTTVINVVTTTAWLLGTKTQAGTSDKKVNQYEIGVNECLTEDAFIFWNTWYQWQHVGNSC